MRFLTLCFVAAAILLKNTAACLHSRRSDTSAQIYEQLRDRTVPPPVKTAITNVHVFDGYKLTEPQTVIIDGKWIGQPSSNYHVDVIIDGENKILIPGLMDSHAHPANLEDLEILTSYGITTVFNMACWNYASCMPLRGLDGVCDMVTAGQPALGPNGGHANLLHVPSDELFYPNSSVEAAVDFVFNNGSDFFKIIAEPNGPTQGNQNDLAAACQAKGKQSVTHAANVAAFQQAVISRTNGIQHVAIDGTIDYATIALVARNRQFVTPTLYMCKYTTSNLTLLEELQGSPATANQTYAYAKSNTKALHASSVTLLAGTDAIGVDLGLDIPFGHTLHCELEYLVEAGWSPAEALRAATSLPAKAQRKTDRGIVAPGLRADLILLNSNPLLNISNTRDIARVWVGGIEYTNVTKSVGAVCI